ncbi:carboxylesterase 5A-like [Haliotis rufescens]|uniref:carboxylesterase 5A-like n=1 Tax=Haliotis rufescens TaxID=6454 RepID=UPI00201EF991|nr:carboxylesterase 5A-like [Haliotis rufescens]
MLNMIGILVIVLVQAHLTQCAADTHITVDTKQGRVKGYHISSKSGYSLQVFLGIPYAEPPVGDLRFARPIPAGSWHGIHDATFYRPICPQRLSLIQTFSFGPVFNNTNEDCLYLNVFAPMNGSKLPVMVWIHGGAYKWGSASEYDGRMLASRGIVLVTIDYRLGVLGFLSTGDDAAPGNFGHLDQLLALQWVKDNIGQFGGNPDKVTIFGQSSGGAGVSSHMFSPLAKGLFRGVISQSGISVSPFAFYRPPYKASDTARNLGKIVGCNSSSSHALVACLRGKSTDDLVNARPQGAPMTSTYVPVVDGYYMLDFPENLLEQGRVLDLPLMTGTVLNEGADMIEYIGGVEKGVSSQTAQQEIHSWSQRYHNQTDIVYKTIACHYDFRSANPLVNRQNLIAFWSDYDYVAPNIRMVDAYHKIQPSTYMYSFEYRSVNQPDPQWEGVLHATDLHYVFGCPFPDTMPCPWRGCNVTWCSGWGVSHLDKTISYEMMTLWTNFAKTLDPNTGVKTRVQWPRYSVSAHRPYLQIRDTPNVQHSLRPSAANLWNRYLPNLLAGKTGSDKCHGGVIIG